MLEGNHFGFWSDAVTSYTSSPNTTNASLSVGDYVYITENYFGCASSTGLNVSNNFMPMVYDNVFGVFPDPVNPAVPASPAAKCATTGTYAIHVGDGADSAEISNNIISGSQYGISVGGPAGGAAETTSNTSITGNQIGAFYDSDDGWVTARSPQYGVYLATSGGGNTIGGTNVATADDNLNDSNVIAPYDPDIAFKYRTGIYIWDAMDYTAEILGNFIGTNPECDPVNNRGACEVFTGTVGVNIYYSNGVTIGGDVNTDPPCQAGNVIANMSGNGEASFGVKISYTSNRYHTVNCNTFFDNGGGALDDAFHQIYATPTPSRPVITAADTTTVRVSNIWGGNGTTQEGNIVEVYLADFDGTEFGEGVKLVGLTQAVFGQTYVDVDISAAGLSAGDWVTATRTWHYGGQSYQTSPFSTNLKITGSSTAPSLDWVGTGNYVADGVDPDSASHTSTFTFRVEYTDTDGTSGDPPVFIEVWVDVDDDGSYESTEKFAMTEVDPGDTDYSDGKLYEKDMSFNLWPSITADDGVLNYRFTASDGSFYTVTGDPTYSLLDDTNTVTLTNAAPVLEWSGEANYIGDGVNPDPGAQGSTFTFRVKYTDADNNPPSTILVWLDRDDNGGYSANEDITMTLAADAVPANDGDYTNGEIYTRNTSIALNGDGVYNYRFSATDGAADATGDPTYNTFPVDDTNTVTLANNAPSLDWTGEANYTLDGVDPGSGVNGSNFTFRVEYTDTDGFVGNPPTVIEVWIDQNGNSSFEEGEKYAMSWFNDGDGINHTTGEIYTKTQAVSGSGDVLYRFYATDGKDATDGAASGDPTSETLNTVSITNTTAPTLNWTGETDYVGDGVHPGSAASGSSFTFRVDYTDADDNPPVVIEVWIDENDNGSYEEGEKHAMTAVDGGDTVYTDGKLYTFTKALLALTEYSNTVHNYRFYASDGDDATGAPAYALLDDTNTFTVEPCNMVDPNGTYFEAENFTSTIAQGSSTFALSTQVFDGGHSGKHLQGIGTDNYATPPTEEGKVYWLNFPTTGNYTVWIRAAKPGSTSQSVFIGKDMVQTNVEVAEGGYWDWEWNTGSPTPITISTAGEHALNIWVREDNFRLDAIYISDGSNPPFDEDPAGPPTGAKVIYPSVCQNTIPTLGVSATAFMAGVDPDGNPGTDDASIGVSMSYFYDDDNDNTYTVDYKLSSEPVVWTNWITDAAHTVSPYTTTITGLKAGESYDVRMTYNDPDGVINQQTISTVVLDYVVTNTNDSGPGSLRQVLNVLLAEGGNDNIIFNIPASLLTDGVAVIDLETNLPSISVNGITIDGATQTANVGDTNTRGPEVRIDQSGTSTTGFTIIGVKGRHDGADNAAVLTDTSASWTVNDPDFIGKTIKNVTDNSSGIITSNTETTITASLSGGTDADWDSYDTYRISGIGDFIYIENLQITGFTTGVISSGYVTDLVNNHFGFWSDSNSTYTSDKNGKDAVISGQYAEAFNGNYFGCANSTGLDISDSYDAYVDDNFFGMYPNGTLCSTTGTGIKVNDAVDAYIGDNIISSGSYGIILGGTSSGTYIRGNQIGVYYSGSVPTGSWVAAFSPSVNGIRIDTSGTNNVIGGSLVALDDDSLRNSNVIKPYGTSTAGTDISKDGGIYVLNAADNGLGIQGNFIGTNPDCDPVNDLPGCEVFTGGRGIMVNDSDLVGLDIGSAAPNMIANMTADSGNGDGVHVIGSNNVKISRNVFFNNGDNIGDDAIVLGAGGNGNLSRPTVSAATTSTVTVGGVLSGETVEVYLSDYDGSGTEYGEGKTFVGTAVSVGTTVAVDISAAGLSVGDWVTAIRIQADGDTSTFSTNFQLTTP
jgi:hypothetical protein